jgi:hypothetical protein
MPNICESCKEWTKNASDGLCAACHNEQTEAQEIEKANQRLVQKAEALKSRNSIVSSDNYLQTFCVTAYAAKTTNKE